MFYSQKSSRRSFSNHLWKKHWRMIPILGNVVVTKNCWFCENYRLNLDKQLPYRSWVKALLKLSRNISENLGEFSNTSKFLCFPCLFLHSGMAQMVPVTLFWLAAYFFLIIKIIIHSKNRKLQIKLLNHTAEYMAEKNLAYQWHHSTTDNSCACWREPTLLFVITLDKSLYSLLRIEIKIVIVPKYVQWFNTFLIRFSIKIM